MNNNPLYSTRIIRNYIEFISEQHPEIKTGTLIEDTGITPYQLEDDGHWLTQDQVDRFHNKILNIINNPNLPREAGRIFARSKASGVLSQYALGFITPGTAYTMLDKLFARVTRAHHMTVENIDRNKIRVTVAPKEGVEEKRYQCENRYGAFESIASLFTGKLAAVEHTSCIHKGDRSCIYIISWEQPPSFIWKRIRNYGSLIAAFFSLSALFFLPAQYEMIFTLSMAFIVASVFLYTEKLEKKEISAILKNQNVLAQDLLDQISVSYDNSLLVQEIGQATSEILGSEKILDRITNIMAKHLKFDRGMIFLANKDRNRLVYANGYGFDDYLEKYLKSISFHLDNPSSKGEMVRAFREQKPFMVIDANKTRHYLSERTKDFVTRLETDSFICVPIVHEGKSLGVLAVDAPQSGKPPSQSDVNLILGIATQIGASLNSVVAYQKLRESEERFRNLSENIPDIIATIDMEGRIAYTNPAVEKILGYQCEEMVGRYVVDFAKEELRDVYHRLMKRVRDGKETVKNFQGNLRHKDGTERLFDINCAPNLDSEENITGLVANLKDITEQHLLEAQLHHASKMEAIGTLTGGISHDFNNILQALNGYTQLLFINKEKTDRDWHYLVNIEEMIERATNLTRQLLLFSRKADIKPEPLDFNNEIRKCFDILSQTITKMITIKLDLAADLGIINGDATQMGQIIMNLILNSRDAMPEGGTVTITSDNEEVREDLIFDDVKIESGKYVKISVSDTGMGMTREVKNRIFEPFFTTKDGKGTGLGLPVVYGIVKNHNGVITCHSELGRGSTFTVYLPRIDAHEKIASKTKAISSEQRLAGKETIFIVDDEEMLLETGKAFLDQYGYKILTARNGEEAVEIFAHRKEDIDLVLLDLIMPGMGGHKCLEGLLQIDPSIPVVITSGYTAGIDAQEIIKRGAAGFINKPYKLQTLIMEIRRILDQSKRKHSAEGGNETDIAQLTLF